MQLTIDAPSILVCIQPVDFRKSIDGLVAIVKSSFETDPRASIFVFYNRARDRIKVLAWHKNGFVLLLKRLEKGHFFAAGPDEDVISASPQQLSWLIAGLDWAGMSRWGELTYRDFR